MSKELRSIGFIRKDKLDAFGGSRCLRVEGEDLEVLREIFDNKVEKVTSIGLWVNLDLTKNNEIFQCIQPLVTEEK